MRVKMALETFYLHCIIVLKVHLMFTYTSVTCHPCTRWLKPRNVLAIMNAMGVKVTHSLAFVVHSVLLWFSIFYHLTRSLHYSTILGLSFSCQFLSPSFCHPFSQPVVPWQLPFLFTCPCLHAEANWMRSRSFFHFSRVSNYTTGLPINT